MTEAALIFYAILSIPALMYAFSIVGLLLVNYSDLWVTNETIQLGITDHLYFCAIYEAAMGPKK